ncbi:hypothetical protein GCM10009560_05460 [Nonomuraea longicatena]|uniref:Uncharacterized protein n=1 Tax=Nonomuraea longicatena TaxID=83682 RepID=A0ABN1NP02_9ACTN
MLGRAAHRARCAVGQVAGEFGGHAVEPRLAHVEPVFAPPMRLVDQPRESPGRGRELARQRVTPPGGLQHATGGVERGDGGGQRGRQGLDVGQARSGLGQPGGKRLGGGLGHGVLGGRRGQPGRPLGQLAVRLQDVGDGGADRLRGGDPRGGLAGVGDLRLGALDEGGQVREAGGGGLVLGDEPGELLLDPAQVAAEHRQPRLFREQVGQQGHFGPALAFERLQPYRRLDRDARPGGGHAKGGAAEGVEGEQVGLGARLRTLTRRRDQREDRGRAGGVVEDGLQVGALLRTLVEGAQEGAGLGVAPLVPREYGGRLVGGPRPAQLAVCGQEALVGGGGGQPCRPQQRPRPPERIGLLIGRGELSRGLLDALEREVDPLPLLLALAPEQSAPLGQPRLGLGEDLDGEQPLQQSAAVFATGAQEAREVALWQHGHLAELVGVHAEQPADQVAGLVEARGEPLPRGPGLLLHDDLGVLLGEPAAAPFGPLPGGRADDAQSPPPYGHLQRHRRPDARRRVVAAQAAGAVALGVGHLAEQREAQRVEHGRLARARRPVDEEEPGARERVERHRLGRGEGAERGEGEQVGPH